jgi:hypothetical protein
MSGYVLSDSFEIDAGELDGFGPSDAFVLGVEWAVLRERLAKDGGCFTAQVHASNEARVLRLLHRHGRRADARRVDRIWTEVVVSPRVYQ